MNKNVKRMFFVAMLLVMLVGVTAISASDVSDDTTAIEDTSETVAPEEMATATSDNSVETAKILEKEDKNLKTSTKTVAVNSYDELTTAMNNAVNDSEVSGETDTYIINLNEGTYYSSSTATFQLGTYTPNIIINANNQTLTAKSRSVFRNHCNNTINQADITHTIYVGQIDSANLTLNQVTLHNELRVMLNATVTLSNSTICSKVNISHASGTLIINDDVVFTSNSTLTSSKGGTIIVNNTNIIYPVMDTFAGESTFTNITIDKNIVNNGIMTLKNVVIDKTITNNGKLIISDDTIFTDNTKIEGDGEIEINDTSKIAPFVKEYTGNINLINSYIDSAKINYGNLTVVNSTINTTIKNNGVIYIDDDTTFGENAQISGLGNIVTNNITKLLPYLETISGNYTITDTLLDKKYNFNGNITLKNCNITSNDNENYGLLYINNNNIQIEDESNWIKNYGVIIIDEESTTTGNIDNHSKVFNGDIPEDYKYDPTCHIVTNDTILLYFDTTKANNLSSLINEGDTLDFQGTISGIPGLGSLVINKPINIITSTNDGRIENFSSITYNNGASGSNITGLYTYNTQFYVRNAHNMVFDNISNVVISKGIGWGVGQTSIRENSTNITVKNSYFYTKDNGGSSTFVFGWADNCTLINSTIETDGTVGNLVYLTTYQVTVPSGVVPNSNNQILNNIIIGPETPAAICWGIVLTGSNNTIANNRIYYKGIGITNQWGSGIDGVMENETSLVTIENNTLTNNTHIKHKPTNELIIDTTTFTPGETTTIQATIRFTNQIQTNITAGKVTFKVDGKTLKDSSGKVIYAKIVNGTATIENYTIPNTWKEGSTIQAIYSGSTQCDKLNSEKTEITINKEAPTFTIEPVEPATIGSTITLKATITDNNKVINTGKVVFKINGKTLKDANGKVIYAKVVNNEVIVEYSLPDSYKAKDYTITATLISPDYERLEDSETLTVN